MVQCDFEGKNMASATDDPPSPKGATTRASVTFPNDLYAELESLAREKKVSVAWIVREAAEQYVTSRYPLFPGRT